MNLSKKQRQIHRQRTDVLLPRLAGLGVEKEWAGIRGLADTSYYKQVDKH